MLCNTPTGSNYCQPQHAQHAAALTLLDLIPDKQKAEEGDRGDRCERSGYGLGGGCERVCRLPVC